VPTTQEHGKGLIPFSPEQLKKIEQTWPCIVDVKPNKVGIGRILEHMKQHGLAAPELIPASPDEEFVKVIGSSALKNFQRTLPAVSLPSSVNNSILPSFPPIGDQQAEGSCVAWASTYYQASHEIGLLNGYNNKTSNAHVLSPRWTYNLLNGGYDGGLSPDTAFFLLAYNGAPSISSFPYVNGDVTSWDLNPQDWIAAISNRLAPAQYVTGIGGQTQNLTTIKQLLTNGHVLTFATFIDSWVFTQILKDPANPNSPYVGQSACTYMNGWIGGHFITIIGYDDNIWIDVNGNGQVDAGERGAFLVANSWGTFWGNTGYTWISYDAFLNTSAVPNGPSANRIAAAESNNVFSVVPKAANYSPSLIGEFTLNQSYRNQISVVAGVSSVSQTTPTQTFFCYALMNQGGPLEFNGTVPGTPQTATFAVDLTDLLGTSTTAERYYLGTADSTAGNPTTLTAYSLLDLVHNTQVNYSGTPLQCDNSTVTPYIDYTFANTPPPKQPVVNITSPANNGTVQGTITVSANAKSNVAIARVELFIDSAYYLTDVSSPYQFSLDTTKLTNGSHQLTAIAYDTAGNSSQSSIAINAKNTVFVINVNCGGPAVLSTGIDYSADTGYTTPSSTYTTNTITFFEPVYFTQRNGSNFSYNFSVPNGQYYVELQFAEIYFQQPGQRVFSVNINGSRVITNLDLIAAAGYGAPYLTGFPITVANGMININLFSSINNAAIGALQITKTN
jgi:C1A family cysteine protease